MHKLTKNEYDVLKSYEAGYDSKEEACFETLCSLKYLNAIPTNYKQTEYGYIPTDCRYELTNKGKAYIEYCESEKHKYWLERLIFPIIFTLLGALLAWLLKP